MFKPFQQPVQNNVQPSLSLSLSLATVAVFVACSSTLTGKRNNVKVRWKKHTRIWLKPPAAPTLLSCIIPFEIRLMDVIQKKRDQTC